jgi:putative oxidoreductase
MRFFSHLPFGQAFGIALVRMVVGLLLIYHGQEVFQPKLMESYLSWDNFKGSNGKLLVYLGKSAELLAGVFLFLGLFTRFGALICIGALSYITFVIGKGRFWYEDQHPFMFVLFGVLFLFTGAGNFSLDRLFFGRKNVK